MRLYFIWVQNIVMANVVEFSGSGKKTMVIPCGVIVKRNFGELLCSDHAWNVVHARWYSYRRIKRFEPSDANNAERPECKRSLVPLLRIVLEWKAMCSVASAADLLGVNVAEKETFFYYTDRSISPHLDSERLLE